MSEKCQMCGKSGEDRRTLWMACFYAMEELGIPFKQEILFDGDPKDMTPAKEPATIDLPGSDRKINLSPGTVKSTGELTPHQFYTLRVCKDCRASWMTFISAWWATRGYSEPKSTGTGVFVRRRGTNVELTEEEVEEYRQTTGQEPVRVK